MLVEVAFGHDRIDLDVPDDRLVGAWSGPAGLPERELPEALAEALSRPVDLPPLRQTVVPGDRVAIALGAGVPHASAILRAVWTELEAAGIQATDVTVLIEPDGPAEAPDLPRGFQVHRHDPEDRTRIAYLAATSEGRRVYLDRDLTDADAVVAIGRLGYDPALGYSGPWGVIFPGLSDEETRAAFHRSAREAAAGGSPGPAMREAAEVGWLLGSLFQVGVVPGVTGIVEIEAGLATSLAERGPRAVNRRWRFRAESRSELVVVGIGGPGSAATLTELATALTNATRLVQRGGKIAVLSNIAGAVGPAVQRLRGLDDPRRGASVLKGHENDPDHREARRIVDALAWADVYLLSRLDSELVDDLAMIPLDRPEEVRRLVAVSGSTLVVNQAERVRAEVASDAPVSRP